MIYIDKALNAIRSNTILDIGISTSKYLIFSLLSICDDDIIRIVRCLRVQSVRNSYNKCIAWYCRNCHAINNDKLLNILNICI